MNCINYLQSNYFCYDRLAQSLRYFFLFVPMTTKREKVNENQNINSVVCCDDSNDNRCGLSIEFQDFIV